MACRKNHMRTDGTCKLDEGKCVPNCRNYRVETNEDRIRTMPVDQMVDLILDIGADTVPFCRNLEACEGGNATDEMCEACVRIWLNQEAKDDG